MSLWAKLGLGCAGVFLLVALVCGSCVFLGFQKASSSIDSSWNLLYSTAESLKTEEGARRLYKSNPGLKENYPTVEEFVKAAQEWRPKLGPIPQKRPELKALFAGHQMEYNARAENGRQTVSVKYRMSDQGRLCLEAEGSKLVDVRVE
jgi:hypothetical protein